VLVLGGGFAGLSAVHELVRQRRRGGDLGITLVDSRAENTFSPLLPDLISRRVRPDSICFPLGSHCGRLGVEFRQARVLEIAPAEAAAVTDAGRVEADRLIVCVGCETNYFGNASCERYASGLKSVEEGVRIGRRALEMAAGGRRPSFLVAGGGYTGLEAASHLALRMHRILGIPYHRIPSACPITVVEQAPSVLPRCPASIVQWAARIIARCGIHAATGTTLDHMPDGSTAVLSDGRVIDDCAVVWTAGVRPVTACDSLETARVRGGRLAVDAFLRLPGAPRTFAAGDVAGPVPEGQEEPLRMGIQFSLAGGRVAAANAVRSLSDLPLTPFMPFDPGYLVPLAMGHAGGIVMGVEMKGHLPSFLHYSLCMARSWGLKNRVRVLCDLLQSLRPAA
jgi:NADH dehydrogenase